MRNSISITLFFYFIFFSSHLMAQSQLCLAIGGTLDDQGRTLVQTPDSGYVIAGETKSGAGGKDAFFTKIDKKGVTQWTRLVGGAADDYVHSIILTNDGGFAAAGWTNSFGNAGDVYVIKLDKNGVMQWTRAVGTVAGNEQGEQIIQTSDGGYAIAGNTNVNGQDMYLVKLKADGSFDWDKKVGQLAGANSVADNAYSLTEAHGGGYVLCGNTYWYTGVVATSSTDFYAVKVDATGNFVWGSVVRDPFSGIYGFDYGRSITKSSDGGYVMTGEFAKKNPSSGFNWKYGLVKLDGDGSVVWVKCFGSPTNDNQPRQIISTSDNAFAVIGGMSHPTLGLREQYMVKFDSNGDALWNKTFGTTLYGDWLGTPKKYPDSNEGYAIVQTSDGGFAVAGYLADNTGGGGDQEIHFVKFDAAINNCNTTSSIGDMIPVAGTQAMTGSSGNAGGASRTVTDINSLVVWNVIDFCNTVLSVNINTTPILCSLPCSGTATVTITSGKSPFSYLWSTGPVQTTATATGLCAGTYSVTVTDASGSTNSASVNIGSPTQLSLNTSSTDATCGLDNGTASVIATGGTSPFTYSWGTTPAQNTPQATGLAAGTYIVTVTDAGGCSANSSAIVTSSGGSVPASVSISTSTTTICEGTLVHFTALPVNGGNPPLFQWKVNGVNSGTNSDIFSSSTLSNSDTVTCEMTSALPCASGSPATSTPAIITVTPKPEAGVITALRDTICSGTPAILNVTGHTGNIQWQSSPGQGNFLNISAATSSDYMNIPAQTTYYRVYSVNGSCSDTSAFHEIVVKPTPVANFTYSVSGLTVDFNSSGSSGDVTVFEWDFGDGTKSNDPNPSHTFAKNDTFKVSLTVYNGSNCSFTISQDIIIGAVGISNVEANNNLNIYPDPFNSYIHIKNTGVEIITVRIYDVLGRLTLSEDFKNQKNKLLEINTSSLHKGIYFLIIETKEGEYIQKMLKQ